MHLAVLFHRFGPYHMARLEAAARVAHVTAIELSGETAEYAWDKVEGARSFERVTLFPASDSRKAPAEEVRTRLRAALQQAGPEVVAIPGWSDRAAFIALDWCLEHGVPAIVMSESTAHDEPRVWWKEWVKRRLVRLFSTGLIGGRLHADYLAQLGLPRENIFPGYDVVDNAHFASEKARSGESGAGSGESKSAEQRAESRNAEIAEPELSTFNFQLSAFQNAPLSAFQRFSVSAFPPPPYFLASARFIEKKNLPFLLRAYARYRAMSTERGARSAEPPSTAHRPPSTDVPLSAFQNFSVSAFENAPWPLVLLGDGPLRSDLCALISELSLQDSVLLPGFQQYDALTAWYAGAGVFVHASTTEQWGLVVNEAMAAGLPVLVSNRCGCAPDLVQEGVNGYTFDPANMEELAALLLKVSASGFPLSTFGARSRSIVAAYAPEQFGHGLRAAAERALSRAHPRASALDRWLLQRLMRR